MGITVREERYREEQTMTMDNDIIIIIIQVPTLRKCFGIINWYQAELQKLELKTRKLVTIHEQHHQKADVDRLYQYVPIKQGGRFG